MNGSRFRRVSLGLGAVLLAGAAAVAQPAPPARFVPTTRNSPDEFGTQDYGVTVVWAGSFSPQRNFNDYPPYFIGPDTFGRAFLSPSSLLCLQPGELADAYATANIPSGAIIDFIGLETNTPVFATWGVDLVLVDRHNAQTVIGSVNSTVHGWDSDYNAAPLGFELTRNVHNALVVHVQEAGNDQACAFLGWVEIWWRRQVSPLPVASSFDDVPLGSQYSQFIEALKAAGITGGCQASPPLYCPDRPITRAEMAVYLSLALGLHWPD
jgi:hypothetical protein